MPGDLPGAACADPLSAAAAPGPAHRGPCAPAGPAVCGGRGRDVGESPGDRGRRGSSTMGELGHRDHRRVLVAGLGSQRAPLRNAPREAAAGADRTTITEMGAANDYMEGVPAAGQRGVRRGAAEAGERVPPPPPSPKAELPEILCLKAGRTVGNDNCVSYKGQDAAGPATAPPVPLRVGQGDGPRVRGRRDGGLPRGPEAGALRCAGEAAGPGRSGGMSRSAALLGSLRSPRRAAEPQTGHFTCSERRTFHLLPTRRLAIACHRSEGSPIFLLPPDVAEPIHADDVYTPFGATSSRASAWTCGDPTSRRPGR